MKEFRESQKKFRKENPMEIMEKLLQESLEEYIKHGFPNSG